MKTTERNTITFSLSGRRYHYVEIDPAAVPANVRFDVPPEHQGQIVEFSFGGFGSYQHDVGDTYCKVVDQSLPGSDPDHRRVYQLCR